MVMGSVHALAARVRTRTSSASAATAGGCKGGQNLSGDELGQLSSILQRVKLVQMVFKAHTQAEEEVVRGSHLRQLPQPAPGSPRPDAAARPLRPLSSAPDGSRHSDCLSRRSRARRRRDRERHGPTRAAPLPRPPGCAAHHH